MNATSTNPIANFAVYNALQNIDYSNFYKKSETSSAIEIDEALENLDLSEYYKKSETSSKTEIDNMVAGFSS